MHISMFYLFCFFLFLLCYLFHTNTIIIAQALAEKAVDRMDYRYNNLLFYFYTIKLTNSFRGSQVTTSAKLASIAPPGSILISVDIYYLIMSDLVKYGFI